MVMVTDVRPKALIVKATFGSRTRRFAVDGPAARLEKITGMIRDRFEISSPAALRLYYVNGRGEMVYVESESEFAAACNARGVRGRELALIVDRAGPALPCGGLLTKLQQARQATDELERLVDRLHDVADLAMLLGEGSTSITAPADALRSPEGSHLEGFDISDFQLPQWVSREVFHYETIPAEPPGALSDMEDMEAETDLLPSSPHPAAGSHDDESEQPILPKAAPLQISLHSAYISAVVDYVPIDGGALESAFQPYKDEDELVAGRATQIRVRRAGSSSGPNENGEIGGPRSSVTPKVKFQTPFPAFVPFPPSPTRSTPVFSLSETTPFPFRVTTATSTTCACRCTCGEQGPAPGNHSARAPAVAVAVQTEPKTEPEVRSKTFGFSVSVGTQHCAEPTSCAPSKTFGFSVSVGTQHDGEPTSSVGTQSNSPSRATLSVGTLSDPAPEGADDRDAEYEFI